MSDAKAKNHATGKEWSKDITSKMYRQNSKRLQG